MRNIICHYHIYKNSGTSFDVLLEKNFKDRHIAFDGPFPFFTIDQEQLSKVIARKQNVIAFSSHQIQLPVPASLEFRVIPVVFVREPLLRIQSIYRFKRSHFDGTSTSKAAGKLSFDDWIQYCIEAPHEFSIISNAQTRFLGGVYNQKSLMLRRDGYIQHDLTQAVRNISNVTLLGRTEYFDEDVGEFPKILQEFNIDFEVFDIKPQNTTSGDTSSSMAEKLDSIKLAITDQNYQALMNANAQDRELFEEATRIIKHRRSQSI